MYIRGEQHINRAVDGDIVAFELLPEDEWQTRAGHSGNKEVSEVCIFLRSSQFGVSCSLTCGIE